VSLFVIATPIGHAKDISLRAIETLQAAEVVIGEEFKEVSKLLKGLDIKGKPLEVLNEHSTPEDVQALLKLCQSKIVALVSDCGTPGFCDPGAALIHLCRKNSVEVRTLPGASSIMGLLSLSGERINQFIFRGFLPAENEARATEIKKLKTEKRPMILMDTPYRLKKLLTELSEAMPNRRALLACDLTQETEMVAEALVKDLSSKLIKDKAEFMLLLFEEK
jgi:16S rRNA (cytidine1402-2'-O)-methyltransferase